MKIVLLVAAVAACALAAEPLVANCRSQNRNWMYESVLPDRPWGADRWGGMCPEWAACDGPMQSPIDLSVHGARGMARHMDFDYRAQSTVAMFNTGRAVKIPFSKAGDAPGPQGRGEGGNSISRNGEVYYLREVQFHTPSEHRVNGVEFDLEIQFIHDSFYEPAPGAPVNNHAVVSVFYNRGMHSWFLDQLFFDLPEFDHCWCGNNRLESFAPFSEQCDNGERNADVADACRSDCTLPRCGDGIQDKCEQCDEGLANSDTTANACRTNCVRPACGDGVVDDEEECDDGNRHNLDGCSSICKLECGDDFANTDARCDPDLANPDDCDVPANQCQPGQFPWRGECGGYNWPNGVEECDDGFDTINAPNGCRAGCLNSFCGDLIVDDAPVGRDAEECDGTPDCLPTCVLNTCGDGVQLEAEECDDGVVGNIDDVYDPITGAFVSGGSGCSTNCTRTNINGEPFCGDGNLQNAISTSAYFEQCDEGPLNSQQANAFCRENCVEARCGDSIVDPFPNSTRPGEQCDEGAMNGASLPQHPGAEPCLAGSTCTVRCDATCTLRCGNGIIEPAFGEECDNTDPDNQAADSICRPWCRLAFCGDGIVDPVLGEDCDDGAANDDAGRCTTQCRRPVCGDGNVNYCVYGEEPGSNCANPAAECRCVLDLANEECDNAGDNSQSAECNTDCRLNCGNGRIDDNEECDDGFDNSMTASNACRPFYTDRLGNFSRCVKHVCGDGVTDEGEQCDDGNNGSPTCRDDCTLPYCGDGIVDASFGEECDNGAMNSDVDSADDACSTDCVLNRCRRNVKSFGDALDFEMAFPMHNHSSICYKGSLTAPPCTTATNWIVFEQPQQMSVLQFEQLRSVLPHAGSEFEGQAAKRPLQPIGDVDARRIRFCDDVSMAPPQKCGNGIEEAGEQCDHGLGNSDTQSDACRTNCQVPKCGDGVVDMGAGEECEPPMTNGCSATCHWPERRVNPRNPQKWNYKRSGDWWMSEADCDGDKQSPIDVRRDHTKDFGDADTNYVGTQLQVNYGTNVNVNLFHTGDRAVWTVDGANTITIADEGVYTLSHITLHHPSEHTIEGKSADFEVQYHHQQGETWASIAVLYDVSEMRSAFLDQFFFHMPRSNMPMCGNGKIENDVSWWSEECDDGHLNSDFKPNACRTNCVRPTCGDGVVDRGEMCDDGVWNSGDVTESLLTRAGRADACRVQCVLPYCGDGILDSNEQCDDGNNVDGDGCSKKCEQECGDGVVGPGEDCDDGADNSNTHPNACRVVRVCNPLIESPATCNPYDNGVRLCRSASCGDGVVDAGEDCDLGLANGNVANGCRSNCTLPTCGDGVTDFAFGNEQCDDAGDTPRCFANCTLKCGDGLLQPGEECDAGAANSDIEPNACRSNCLAPSCGDGVVDENEFCDHAGTPDIFCTSLCQQGCGNGIVEAGEECDDGTGNNNGMANCCRFNCMNPSCGDGILDAGEECDEAAANGSPASHCNALCRLKRCGDGEHWVGVEECDGTPGCSPTCRLLCGNGLKDDGEECDDGDENSRAPGACRPDCTLPRCNDGVVDHMLGEQCDSGANSNAPNACRPDCTLPTCGDLIVDDAYGEQCDDGAAVNSDINSDFGDSNVCSCDCKYAHYGRTRVTGADLSTALPALKSKSVYCYEGSGPYDGSLRRPPCNERALWIVYAEVQHMSMRQAHDFMDVFAEPSSRGVQCSEGRDVEYKTLGQSCGNCKREGTEECDDGELNSDTKSGACRTNCRRAMCGDGVVDHTEGEQCEPSVHDGCDEFCRWMTSCPVSASGGSCPNNSCGASCASGSCSNAQQVPQDSTVINVNFANMLSKSACTTCSR